MIFNRFNKNKKMHGISKEIRAYHNRGRFLTLFIEF